MLKIEEIFSSAPYFVISIISAIISMLALSLIIKTFGNVSLKEELAQKDNPAAGFSLAGAVFALGCVISGATAGDFGNGLINEIGLISMYSIVGILTLIASRYLFDNYSFPGFSIHAEILKQNKAAGIADMGNTVATGLILLSILFWVDSTSYFDVVYVLAAWVISQFVLFIATLIKNFEYRLSGSKTNLETLLNSGNTAIAIRLAAYRISIALSIMATTSIISFDFDNILETAVAWLLLSILFSMISIFSGYILRKIFLKGIDINDELENQNNIGLAAIVGVLYIVGSLIIVGICH